MCLFLSYIKVSRTYRIYKNKNLQKQKKIMGFQQLFWLENVYVNVYVNFHYSLFSIMYRDIGHNIQPYKNKL